jgi:hypothetical protein
LFFFLFFLFGSVCGEFVGVLTFVCVCFFFFFFFGVCMCVYICLYDYLM